MSLESRRALKEVNSPLAVPLFRLMWVALMISNLGTMFQSVGASWLMTTLTASPVMVALVQAAATAPIMLLGLLAGAIADNRNLRHVMLAAQIFMMVMSIALVLVMIAGWINPYLLLMFTFLIACGTAINWPAMQVSVAEIVPQHAVPKAVALNAMGVNIARSIGPAVGGAVISALGVVAAFIFNALSYIALISLLSHWKYEQKSRLLPAERLPAAMSAGLRYAALSPVINAVLLRAIVYGLMASAPQSLMPLIARGLAGGGALTYGLLLGSFGLGAVAGALSIGRLRARWSTEAIVRNGCMLGAAGCALSAGSDRLWLTMIAMAMSGASWLMVLSTFNVTIQLSSPRWVVARSLSLYQATTFGGVAIGSWCFGTLAAHWGSSMALLAASGGMALVASLGLCLPIIVRSEADLGPRTGWEIPETAIPVDLRSGPIMVAFEHRIHPENALKFSALMAERARILRRDGARRWSLGRDLADPQLWIERYVVPTWFDYVLLNQRRTQDDLSVQTAIDEIRVLGTLLVTHRVIERQSGALPWSRGPDLALIDSSSRIA